VKKPSSSTNLPEEQKDLEEIIFDKEEQKRILQQDKDNGNVDLQKFKINEAEQKLEGNDSNPPKIRIEISWASRFKSRALNL